MLGSIIGCNIKNTNLSLIFAPAAFVLSAPVNAQTTAGPITEKEKSTPSSSPLVLEYDGTYYKASGPRRDPKTGIRRRRTKPREAQRQLRKFR
jgi:hypothetical protein